MKKLSIYLLILSVLGWVACDDQDTPDQPAVPVEKTIGAAGGTISSDNNALTLTIAQGTLTQETAVKIEPIQETVPNGVGSVFRVTPDGQTFAKPVTLTLKYDDAALAQSKTLPEFLRIATRKSGGNWETLSNIKLDKTNKTLSVETAHFSDWTVIAVDGTMNLRIGDQNYTNLPVKLVVSDRTDSVKTTLIVANTPNSQFNIVFYGAVTAPKRYISVADMQATVTTPTNDDYSYSKIYTNTQFRTNPRCGSVIVASDTLFVELNSWGETAGSLISGEIKEVSADGQRSRITNTTSVNCTNWTSTGVPVSGSFAFIRK